MNNLSGAKIPNIYYMEEFNNIKLLNIAYLEFSPMQSSKCLHNNLTAHGAQPSIASTRRSLHIRIPFHVNTTKAK